MYCICKNTFPIELCDILFMQSEYATKSFYCGRKKQSLVLVENQYRA